MGKFLKVYKLELSTLYPNEIILKNYILENWYDTSKKIDELKKLKLENVEINLFREDEIIPNEWKFIDNFNLIEKQNLNRINKNKKNHSSLLYGIGAIGLFPILLTKELTKQ